MQEKLEKYFRAKEAYYTGNPIMDDASFDELENELRDAGLLNEDNEQVGYQTLNAKVKHWNSMLSLEKIQVNDESDDEFQKILKWVKKVNDEMLIGWKFDGSAISAQVKILKSEELGILSSEVIDVLTRGDGTQGISVKEKLNGHILYVIKDLIIAGVIDDTGLFELRGECLIKKDVFASKYNEYKNPRNYVAGLLNRDYSENDVDAYNDLDVIVFDIIRKDGLHCDMKAKKHKIETIKDVRTIFNEFKKQRHDFPYLVDGIVLKASSIIKRVEMGQNKHHPLWATAIKFPSTIVQTDIVDFEYTVTKQ